MNPMFKNRHEMVDYFIKEFNLSGDIVEVGCALFGFSGFSWYMFDRIDARFFMVDSWDPKSFYRNVTQEEMNDRYNTAIAMAMTYKNVYPIRAESVSVSRAFRDQSLSMVYIDAKHDVESVRADRRAWYPKIKSGGIMAGHDYHMPGVRKAVDEFFTDVKCAGNEGDMSWWVIV